LRPEEGNSQEPVALETAVVATGARPGGSSAKRELFTEETQTVLVFEKGAVIRLSAAVADGQLLFLTNKATGKEVVTQVKRKRSFRPTNCYVDLEFTEPCPGFWGIEFPKGAATASTASANVAKKLALEEDSESETVKAAAPPSAHEVERLKQEVTTLQTQLKSLPKTGPNAPPESTPQPELKAASEISAEIAKKEEEKRLEELFALEAKQEEASGPKILVAHPQKSAEGAAKKKGSRKLLSAVSVMLAVSAAAFAAYRFGGLDDVLKMAGVIKPAPSRPAAVVTKAPPPKPVVPAPTPATAAPAQTSASGNVAITPAAPLLEEKNPATVADAANVTTWKDNTSDRTKSAASPASSSKVSGFVLTNPELKSSATSGSRIHSRVPTPAGSSKLSKNQPTADTGVKPESAASGAVAAASPVTRTDMSTPAAVDAEGVVAPKLIRGRKSMAPPEMIKNYITGNVNVDAVVDATGHVRSVTVLSGPEKLRATAIEQMKQYLYQPAKKNGKPVPAHVQVSLQFWYEP
jgi:hypothetical protein